MVGIGPDRTQTLEVLGTRNLLKVLRAQLEAEGVGVATSKSDPPKPVIIEPIQDRLAYDIAIPITKPRLTHNVRRLSLLDPTTFDPIYDQDELHEVVRHNLVMEFATTSTEVHAVEVMPFPLPFAEALLTSITNQVIQRARLTNVFAQLFPVVRDYVTIRCFGQHVDINDDKIRNFLNQAELRDGIAKYLARKIAELTVEKATLQFENADFKLSETTPFSWRRNLPPLVATRTVFNYVATYNDFERRFAEFLDSAKDVLRFASLGTTEQGESGTAFRVDYLKPSGAIGFYHPDWAVVQKTVEGEVNWIIETKGRIWEDTQAKEAAMHEWCARVSEQTGQTWRHARINQIDFNHRRPRTLADVVKTIDDSANLV
jgi:type III restriction enzyme